MSSIRCRDSNPRPSQHESPPITTRPGAPAPVKTLLPVVGAAVRHVVTNRVADLLQCKQVAHNRQFKRTIIVLKWRRNFKGPLSQKGLAAIYMDLNDKTRLYIFCQQLSDHILKTMITFRRIPHLFNPIESDDSTQSHNPK